MVKFLFQLHTYTHVLDVLHVDFNSMHGHMYTYIYTLGYNGKSLSF